MDETTRIRWRSLVDREIAATTIDAADRIKNQMSIAQEALKALLLANGGAMVALFSFVGSVLSKSPGVSFEFHNLRVAFALFVIGFTVDLVAYVMAFLSQDRFFNQAMAELERLRRNVIRDEPDLNQVAEIRMNAQGNIFYRVGLGMACAAVACFAGGCWYALSGVLV